MAIQISGTSVIDNARQILNSTGAVINQGAGIVTATKFSGDGSLLTNITGSNTGIGEKVYTSPGTFTVGTDCPSAITQVKIILLGGGGNGGSTPGSSANAAGGGSASPAQVLLRTVSNGQVYTITIGGASGASTVVLPTAVPTTILSNAGGNDGAPGALPSAIARGGVANVTNTGQTYEIFGSPGGGLPTGPFPQAGPTVTVSGVGLPGGAGSPASTTTQGGYGGSSIFGAGGAGGAIANGGAASGYGSGGGGSSSPAKTGGSGSPGICIISWD